MAVSEQGGIPYLSVDCSEETRERHLKGGFVAKSGETPYVFGAITNALQVANENGAAILVFEEMNSLSPQMQKLINPLTDFRKKIELPELSSSIALREGARLWVVGTMNPSVYGTTYEVNDDLKSRFVELELSYPPPTAEKRILREATGLTIQDGVLDHLVNIANESRQGAMGYEISTRDLTQTLHVIARVGWEDGLFMLGQKFSADDRKLFIDRASDITRTGIHQDLSFRAGLRVVKSD
jgi:nitric oxide reductase NorQ protein